MQVRTLSLGPLQTNCYVLSAANGDTYLVDPGNEAEQIFALLAEEHLTVRAILLTHAHFDHIGAVPELVAKLGVPVLLDPGEEPLYRHPQNCMPPWVGAVQNLPRTVASLPPPLPLGDLPFTKLATPGHTRAGVSFYFAEAHCVFTGDALFAGSVGRTDLPGGDWETLQRALHEVLLRLPDHTDVYPGHGHATTIGTERQTNPFLQPRGHGG